MDVAEFVEQFLRQAFDRREFGDAGIGDEDIEFSKPLAGLSK